jgi:hypothetical protein
VLLAGACFKLSNFVSCRFSSDSSPIKELYRINTAFASPELKNCEAPTRASDVYSLGMILKLAC